jgi:hypothetical protein
MSPTASGAHVDGAISERYAPLTRGVEGETNHRGAGGGANADDDAGYRPAGESIGRPGADGGTGTTGQGACRVTVPATDPYRRTRRPASAAAAQDEQPRVSDRGEQGPSGRPGDHACRHLDVGCH